MARREAERLDAAREPLLGLTAQFRGLVDRLAAGGGEARQDRLARARAERAALRDLDGRGERLGQIGEQRRHLGARLEIVLGRELAPLGFGDEASFGNANQRVVRLVVVGRREQRLIGGDQRNAMRIGEIGERRLGDLVRAVTLQLDIEPVAEQRGEPRAARGRKLGLPGRDREIERAARSAGERDQPIGRRLQRGERHVRRLVGRRIEEGARRQPHQVAIALLARGEQHHARKLEAGPIARRFLVAEIDAERAADDRLDARAAQLVGEFERPEHVVGVGERERGLAVGLGKLRELADGQRAFEQRIGRVHVQVHEAGSRHVLVIPCLTSDGAGRARGCPSA